jgi:hypothetical protein
MAAAVAEALRVLRPGGLLLDVHPEAAPMRLEAWTPHPGLSSDDERADPGDYERTCLGDFAPDDSQADFQASTQALALAETIGFVGRQTVPFEYRYVFDSLDELTDYLEENEELDLAGDALLERALMALQSAPRPARLVLVQPVSATRLLKPAA